MKEGKHNLEYDPLSRLYRPALDESVGVRHHVA